MWAAPDSGKDGLLSAYLWAASYHPEVEITELDWPLSISYSRWFKDFNRQNHNLKGPQNMFTVILSLKRGKCHHSLLPQKTCWRWFLPTQVERLSQCLERTQRYNEILLLFREPVVKHLPAHHWYVCHTKLKQFCTGKKILTPTKQKPNKLKRNLAIVTGKIQFL